MLDVATMIALFGILVFLAHFFAWLFSFTSIPDVLLLLLIGIVLGPVFGVVTPELFGEFGQVILTITLVLMLFESATRLHLGVIKEALKGTLALVIVSFVLATSTVSALAWAFTDLSVLLSVILGVIVGGTSSVVVIPLIDRLKFVSSHTRGLLTVESAFSDVLSIVITISLIQFYQTGNLSITTALLWLVSSFSYAAIVGVVAGVVWSLLLTHVRNMRNSLFVTVAFLFLLYGFVEFIGMSGPITALLFGLTLGNIGILNDSLSHRHPFLRWLLQPTSLSRREKAFFAELVFLLQTFFFVFVGLSISFENKSMFLFAAVVAIVLLGVRWVAVRITVGGTVPKPESFLMSALIPKGLAAAVLASLLVQEQVADGELVQTIVYALVLTSIVATSLSVFIISLRVKNYAGTTGGGDNSPGPQQITQQ